MSAGVAALVTTDPERVTEKVRRAAAHGVLVLTYDQFEEMLSQTPPA